RLQPVRGRLDGGPSRERHARRAVHPRDVRPPGHRPGTAHDRFASVGHEIVPGFRGLVAAPALFFFAPIYPPLNPDGDASASPTAAAPAVGTNRRRFISLLLTLPRCARPRTLSKEKVATQARRHVEKLAAVGLFWESS